MPTSERWIHFHDHSGTTCVLQGQTTLRLEGLPPMRHQAGDCFVMPAGVAMANVNSGTTPSVTLDMFIVPLGGQVWRPVEPGDHGLERQFERAH